MRAAGVGERKVHSGWGGIARGEASTREHAEVGGLDEDRMDAVQTLQHSWRNNGMLHEHVSKEPLDYPVCHETDETLRGCW